MVRGRRTPGRAQSAAAGGPVPGPRATPGVIDAGAKLPRTQLLILQAARHRFARDGYTRASLRAIAADAGVDQRMIAHYFGSKQGLFLAAVGLPVHPAEVLREVLVGPRRTARQRIREVLTRVLAEPTIYERMVGVMRAAAGDPAIAPMMCDFLRNEVVAPLTRLLDAPDAALRITLVGSHFLGLVFARFIVAVEPLASAPPADVAALVAPTFERYLFGDVTASAET